MPLKHIFSVYFLVVQKAVGQNTGPASANMDSIPFLLFKCLNLNFKKPPWVYMAPAMMMYDLVVVS